MAQTNFASLRREVARALRVTEGVACTKDQDVLRKRDLNRPARTLPQSLARQLPPQGAFCFFKSCKKERRQMRGGDRYLGALRKITVKAKISIEYPLSIVGTGVLDGP